MQDFLKVVFICIISCVFLYSTTVTTTNELKKSLINTSQFDKMIEREYYHKPIETETEVIPSCTQTEEATRGMIKRERLTLYSDSPTKTYMDYKTITNKSSKQWQYIHSGEVKFDDDGFLRVYDEDGYGYVGVALGSYFGDIGSRYIFTLEDNKEVRVVKIDEKADEHTCSNNFSQKYDGSVLEFVVDTSKMHHLKTENGLVYGGNFNKNEYLNGRIVKIERVTNEN